ncbi:hypothetical protein BT63DRAFT_24258 [Microthyrium microscopicum]|uniref:Uncharacterized protein n=1 Tax=Microthyrium microscopicum TaxID=703497 RepID=A0A6A6UV23_9PEZI|nr:hypothetical protein BT63DRAFT_24258 [Microthyrium microscopicum]
MASSASATSGPEPAVSPPDPKSPSSIQSPAPTIVPTHFPHKPTGNAPVHPFLDTATPAINSVPIELDSTPLNSPITQQGGTWKNKLPNLASLAAKPAQIPGQIAEKVKEVSKHTQDDPAVMPAPPGTPGPEDFRASDLMAKGTKEVPKEGAETTV